MAGYIGSKASVVSSGAERKKTFAITTSTTSLTGLSYTVDQVHVFHNGVRLVDGTDYTATNGTSITLTSAAENGDEVVVVSYATFQTSDTVSASAGGTFAGDVTFDGSFTSQGIDDNATSTAMTLDGSGNLLVGTTSTNIVASSTATDEGFVYVNGAALTAARSAGQVADFNRITNDGEIIRLRKDGAAVGSIGAGAGGFLTIGSPNGTPVYATFANGSLKPTTSLGSNSDGGGDLGNVSARWKDLYLSGGAYLGGTTSSNKLDDYEEGTYTPVFNYGNAVVYSNQTGRYCKVGNLVFVSIDITITSKSSDLSQVHVSLPFVATHGAKSGVAGSVDYYSSSLVPSSRVAWQPSNYSNDSVRFNGQGGLHTYNSLNSSGRLVAGFTYYI